MDREGEGLPLGVVGSSSRNPNDRIGGSDTGTSETVCDGPRVCSSTSGTEVCRLAGGPKLTGWVRPGGVSRDIGSELRIELQRRLAETERDMRNAVDLLWKSSSTRARFENTAVVLRQNMHFAHDIGILVGQHRNDIVVNLLPLRRRHAQVDLDAA